MVAWYNMVKIPPHVPIPHSGCEHAVDAVGQVVVFHAVRIGGANA